MLEERINLQEDRDVVAAWRSGLVLGKRLGFDRFKQACLSGAVLELSRNIVEHGKKGICVLSDESDKGMLRARVILEGFDRELIDSARAKLNSDVNIGPSLPSVKLQQVAETCELGSALDGGKISLTINQSRPAGRSYKGLKYPARI